MFELRRCHCVHASPRIEGKCLHEFCKMLKFLFFLFASSVDSARDDVAVRTVQIHVLIGVHIHQLVVFSLTHVIACKQLHGY